MSRAAGLSGSQGSSSAGQKSAEGVVVRATRQTIGTIPSLASAGGRADQGLNGMEAASNRRVQMNSKRQNRQEEQVERQLQLPYASGERGEAPIGSEARVEAFISPRADQSPTSRQSLMQEVLQPDNLEGALRQVQAWHCPTRSGPGWASNASRLRDEFNRPNRRIRTRTYGGVGGAEPQGSPLSRFRHIEPYSARTIERSDRGAFRNAPVDAPLLLLLGVPSNDA